MLASELFNRIRWIWERNRLDKDLPFLVSFPRTGSHWLRIMLENYSKRPLLPRSFSGHYLNDYLLCHTHDMNLTVKRSKVIYLYRNPVQVVFSQLNYYEQDLDDINLVEFWSNQYASHLKHWQEESFSNKKLFVKYEDLTNNFSKTFSSILELLDLSLDADRMIKIFEATSKKEVKKVTNYNRSVVSVNSHYETKRKEFISKFELKILDIVTSKVDLFNERK